MAYSNYQEEIEKAVKNGDYAEASRLEQERNEKIDAEGLPYAKTNNYVKPKGVDDATYNKINSQYTKSEDVQNWDSKTNDAYTNFYQEANKKDIISQDVRNALNSQFSAPSAVTEADAYLSEKLQQIQSGRTSYTDQVKAMMDKITNREKFSYDVDTDPLFQQALASAINNGKQAMQDTIGQASALTGGYGSTYATTAGNQAYNAFIEDAYDNLPQYYQMALEAYQMEGDELYRQFGVFSELDDKEFNRNVAAYDATYQYRNRLYDESYNMFRDTKNDAFAMANLQLNEHNQLVSDAYNLYNATSNEADKLYEREYNSWLDSVNMAYQNAQLSNNDYWKESDQQLTISENEKDREHDSNENALNRAHESSENALDRAARSSGGGGGSGGYGGGGNPVYDYTAEEMSKASNSETVKSFKASIMTEREFARHGKSATINGKSVRYDTYSEYVDATLGKWKSEGKLTDSETAYLVGYYFS